MKREEANAIIKILLTADGGCEYCVSNLMRLFCAGFPEFRELANESFVSKFGVDFETFMKERGNYTSNKNQVYRLHGWDDEKVYFWDGEKKKEWCVTDESKLYNKLLRICIRYFNEREDKGK